jgi:HemY protein
VKALVWIVALAACAVALALAARGNTGYALLVLPPYRVELSLNLLLVLLAAGFAAAYAAVRFVAVAVQLPQRARAYRDARRRERAREALVQALREYLAGRHARAEQAAAGAFEEPEYAVAAAVLAARAAHELRARVRRDAHLGRVAPEEPMRVSAEAQFALEEQRFQDALDALARLPRKHTAALKLEFRARQQARHWDEALALIAELERRNVYDPQQAARLRRFALAESLKRKALDTRALERTWEKLPQEERTDPRVALAAAQCFLALGGGEQARRILEQALETEWASELVALYAESGGAQDALARIERAERWLQSHPRDAVLLLALGRLCAERELWGKARSYLEASIAIDPTYSAHLAAAQLEERLGNDAAARNHYRKSLELALAQLRAASGGRRRTPL